MAMPKGKKHENGYATVTNMGLGYREIAEKLTAEGSKMNHATARNKFISAITKLAVPLSKISGTPADEIATNPLFQSAIIDMLKSNERK